MSFESETERETEAGPTPAIVRVSGTDGTVTTSGEPVGTADADIDGQVLPEDAPDHETVEDVLGDVLAHFDAHDGGVFGHPGEGFITEKFFDFSYLDRYEEVERYWVNEPYAYVTVLYDDAEKEYRYRVVEPTLDAFEQYVRQDIVTLLRNSLMYIDIDDERDAREELFVEQARDLIEEQQR